MTWTQQGTFVLGDTFQWRILCVCVCVCGGGEFGKSTAVADRGEVGRHVVEKLVEALHYKSEGRGFDSRCCNCKLLLT